MVAAGICLFLGFIPMLFCDPRIDYYQEQASEIPTRHLEMISMISLWDKPNGESGCPSRDVILPSTNHWDTTVLAHETGHVVACKLNLNKDYAKKFWSNGEPVGLTTPYGSSNPSEDIAECYAYIIKKLEQQCSPERIAWIKEKSFAPN